MQPVFLFVKLFMVNTPVGAEVDLGTSGQGFPPEPAHRPLPQVSTLDPASTID